jgi:monothiol glutaredoxin
MSELRQRIQDVIDNEPVALFMKGTPQFIMCGNSDRALRALREAGAPVAAVDILPDPSIRQELSAISGWPTIPQVFVNGELIGGADIVEEMDESGELAGVLGVEQPERPAQSAKQELQADDPQQSPPIQIER